jgi:hypothetical protein
MEGYVIPSVKKMILHWHGKYRFTAKNEKRAFC